MAYKRDVDDPRESPSFELMELLAARGAKLSYSDPHIPRLPKMRHYDVPELKSSPLTKEYLAEQDCVLIVTDHSAFDYPFIVEHSRLVVDTRNALGAVTSQNRNRRNNSQSLSLGRLQFSFQPTRRRSCKYLCNSRTYQRLPKWRLGSIPDARVFTSDAESTVSERTYSSSVRGRCYDFNGSITGLLAFVFSNWYEFC